MKSIPHFKRLMVFFTLFLLIVSTLWANLFITVSTDAGLNVPEDVYSLQLMAADYNPDGERVLQQHGGMHRLSLGSWIAGTNRTYPAAFAIVNPSDRPVSIQSLSLSGAPEGIQIYLHRHMDKPSNSDIVNIAQVEEPGDTELFYDEGPVSVTPWELQPGDGYSNDDLVYKNGGESATATKDNGVWAYDFDDPLVADEGANFVWVEVSIVPSIEVDSATYRAPIEIEVDAEFDDGSTVTFMGAGRHDGGPTIRTVEGNSIRLSVSDLKPGTTVVVPDAFALVNAGSSDFRVTRIEVEGDTDYMRVYLHGDPRAPAGDYGLEVDQDTGLLYYDGSSHDRSSDGWVIGSGFGYDNDANLLYGKEADTSTATRTAGHHDALYNLWMYDEYANNVAEDGTSNFVWVEVAYIIPEEVGEVNVNSTITFHLSSV